MRKKNTLTTEVATMTMYNPIDALARWKIIWNTTPKIPTSSDRTVYFAGGYGLEA